MRFRKNVDTIDALIRITVGLTGVAWGTAEMMKRRNQTTPFLITMCSAMKVAEGITRYCPMKDVLERGSQGLMEGSKQAMESVRNTVQGIRGQASELKKYRAADDQEPHQRQQDQQKRQDLNINKMGDLDLELGKEAISKQSIEEILENYK